VRAKAAPIDQILTRKGKTWTARLRTGRVAIFQVSVSKVFKAGALIDSAAVVDLAAVIVSVAAAGSVVAVDLAVVVGGLADSVAEDFAAAAAGDEN
jgi:hypothetical protein